MVAYFYHFYSNIASVSMAREGPASHRYLGSHPIAYGKVEA